MRVTLYKATDRTDSFGSGAAFAADEEDAEAYLDNPGYGGSDLIEVEIEINSDEVLSLVDGRRGGAPYGRKARDAWERLGDALNLDEEELVELKEDNQKLIEQAIDRKMIRSQLADAGYLWVVYEDTFPNGAVTWIYVGRKTVRII